RKNPDYVVLRSKSGKEFRGGVFVAAENANLGMFAHDFFHALGGVHDGKRLVPCLYDYERQSDSSRSPNPEEHAIYMGPWDIMSEHFVKRGEPPPGVSSFTKIRLGWVPPSKVLTVKPGETACTFLSPLSANGDTLAVKIALRDGNYYLVENRQPVGFDSILPDSGIVILKVNPEALEGSGTVQVMNADPRAPRFSKAAFRLDKEGKNFFSDQKNRVAIIPLWSEKTTLGVLVSTPDRSVEAAEAASRIQKLLARFPEPRSEEKDRVVRESVELFKKFDFRAAGDRAALAP
ncbi:MAG TPA: hypothetical protein VLS90_15225, partial [Thermodesulfobacteriota bacterium]|nr:hypothetical protein [Thermodesulfobacteriota bacterium]